MLVNVFSQNALVSNWCLFYRLFCYFLLPLARNFSTQGNLEKRACLVKIHQNGVDKKLHKRDIQTCSTYITENNRNVRIYIVVSTSRRSLPRLPDAATCISAIFSRVNRLVMKGLTTPLSTKLTRASKSPEDE